MNRVCREEHADLVALAAGELDVARRPAVERHLGVCPACRSKLADLRAIVAALPDLGPSEIQVRAARRRLDRHILWLERRRRAARRRRVAGLAAAAALLLGFRLMWATVGTEVRLPSIDPRPMVREALEKLPVEALSIGLDWMPFHETDR